jgi:RNA polymerase sigma-32 factor
MALGTINIAPEGNLSRYLQEIRKYPMLTAEEELNLSKAWRDNNDLDAAHKLVTSHLRLVAKIAMGYRGYGLPIGELVSEGGEALRPGSRLPPRHLRNVVDPCGNSGIHPA